MRRPSYHHGDLANALTVAATQLARDGGPEAVVLREAARQVGVSATAAYRHFSGHGDLLHAVKGQAIDLLVASLDAELARTAPLSDPAAEAARRLRALGYGYLRFALAEPGLFRTAFCPPTRAEAADGAGPVLPVPSVPGDAPRPADDDGPRRPASHAGPRRDGAAEAPHSDTAAEAPHSDGAAEAHPELALVRPYLMLVDAVDAFVAAGLLPPERRPWAEVFAWSTVHGLAMLLLDGPLRTCSAAQREEAIERTLDGVARGLATV